MSSIYARQCAGSWGCNGEHQNMVPNAMELVKSREHRPNQISDKMRYFSCDPNTRCGFSSGREGRAVNMNCWLWGLTLSMNEKTSTIARPSSHPALMPTVMGCQLQEFKRYTFSCFLYHAIIGTSTNLYYSSWLVDRHSGAQIRIFLPWWHCDRSWKVNLPYDVKLSLTPCYIYFIWVFNLKYY